MNRKIVFTTLLISTAVSVIGCQKKADVSLKKKKFIVEYGEKVSTSPSAYLKGDQDVIKKTEITISKLKNEKDKAYPKQGTYKATAKSEEEKLTFTIIVKDTKKPVFEHFQKEIKIEQNAQNFTLDKYFHANDLHPVKLSSDLSKAKLDTVGTYPVKIIAKDTAGNITEKTIQLLVISTADVQNGVTLTADLDGKPAVSAGTQTLLDNHKLVINMMKADGSTVSIGTKNEDSPKSTINQNQTASNTQAQNNSQNNANPAPDPAPAPDPVPTVHYTLIGSEPYSQGIMFHIQCKTEDSEIAMQEFRLWLTNNGYTHFGAAGHEPNSEGYTIIDFGAEKK